MRRRTLLFGLAVSALTVSSLCNFSWSQEDGKQGQPSGRGAPGGGQRGGGPGFGGGGGGGGVLSLLRMEEVQKEIALEESQKKEIEAINERLRASYSSGRTDGGGGTKGSGRPGGGTPGGGTPGSGRPDRGGATGNTSPEERAKEMQAMMARMTEARDKAEGEVMLVLDPIQQDRILGLLIQLEDGRALTSSPSLREVLVIDAAQKAKLKSVTDATAAELGAFFAKARESGATGPQPGMTEQMDAMRKKNNTDLLAVMTPEQKAKFEELKGEKFTFPESQSRGGGPGGGTRGGGTRGGAPGGDGAPGGGGRLARPAGPGT